jgi:hypothetical protein
MSKMHYIGTLWFSLGLRLMTVAVLLVALGFMIHVSVKFADKVDLAYAVVRDRSINQLACRPY